MRPFNVTFSAYGRVEVQCPSRWDVDVINLMQEWWIMAKEISLALWNEILVRSRRPLLYNNKTLPGNLYNRRKGWLRGAFWIRANCVLLFFALDAFAKYRYRDGLRPKRTIPTNQNWFSWKTVYSVKYYINCFKRVHCSMTLSRDILLFVREWWSKWNNQSNMATKDWVSYDWQRCSRPSKDDCNKPV